MFVNYFHKIVTNRNQKIGKKQSTLVKTKQKRDVTENDNREDIAKIKALDRLVRHNCMLLVNSIFGTETRRTGSSRTMSRSRSRF